MFLKILDNFGNTRIRIEFIVGGNPEGEKKREKLNDRTERISEVVNIFYIKKPLFGSNAVLISSDRNSRNTPPPSIPTSSRPMLLII